MPKTKKIVQIAETRQVDSATGEVTLSEVTNVIRLPQEPPYVKMYIEDLTAVLDVPAGPRDVLYRLVRRMDYDGLIGLTPPIREAICRDAGIKNQTLYNYISTLTKKSIMKAVGRSTFEMNPKYFAKGDWKDIHQRRQRFTMKIEYDLDGSKTVTGCAVAQMDIEDYLDVEDAQ